ncbi:MAG: methyltransferase domain-containing protein [Armatimonadota bacterium]|nr:methyltransferase domain-containing protein [Armatimonadota bacterium]MDR7451144.1 methyltransferase domain-containing protein [Armatimonadota bacterium]MDR7467251.1 methyltransferase domain-containing protein [Armatimonadota bacterium]MDR7494512.1 methyltransferase domain-containing protein [Armatimonadota bacterium]MDR7499911.1 methyltransferase domain-containing protein [Armatimonadota bacterium]
MPAPARREIREFLDTPGQDPRALAALLSDLRRVNFRYGGLRLVLHYLDAFARQIPRRPLRVLDVATGGADIPVAITAWAARRGIAVRVVAVEVNPAVLVRARERTEREGVAVALVRADALRLPFGDDVFDIVNCGLTLHHFAEDDAIGLLREVDRVAGGAFVIHDVVRSWASYAGAWLDTRLFARSSLARHDGPVSVLRAFTVPEMRDLLDRAGLFSARVRRHGGFRAALVRPPADSRP